MPHTGVSLAKVRFVIANLHIRRILVIFGTYCCVISENPISTAQSFVNLHFCYISVISATRWCFICLREYQNVVWKKVGSTTVVKDYFITSHRCIIVRENCVSSFVNWHIRRILVIVGMYCYIISVNTSLVVQSFVNLHFCYVLVIFVARWCFICEFLFVSPNVGLFGNSFFFLDCLRRTKGYELLILEYQNVVGTKVNTKMNQTRCYYLH